MGEPLGSLLVRLRLKASSAAGSSELSSLYEEVLRAAEEAAGRLEASCELIGCTGVVEGFRAEAARLLGRVEEDPYAAYDEVKSLAERIVRAATVAHYRAVAFKALAGGGGLTTAIAALAGAAAASTVGGLVLGITGGILALAGALLASYRASPLLTLAGALAALAGGPSLLYTALLAAGAVTALLSYPLAGLGMPFRGPRGPSTTL